MEKIWKAFPQTAPRGPGVPGLYEAQRLQELVKAQMTPQPSRQLPDAIKQRDEQHLRMEELYGSGN